ncbi:CARDB domain-containing protein, partial [Candidatus Omnitrophota bacterium]
EEAWHWKKPDQTPVNYGDGSSFLFGKDTMEWYWNYNRDEPPYQLGPEARSKLIADLGKAASVHNDTTFWRYTEAWNHIDDQRPWGGQFMMDVLNGGIGTYHRGDWKEKESMRTLTIGVGWIEGGGPELARLVEYSGSDRLTVSMYSFVALDRHVVARLFRIDSGLYTVSLRADKDGDGNYETIISEEKKHIKRFERLAIQVPSKIPVKLDISLEKADPDPGPLPDLAVNDFYTAYEQGTLTATIHNIGCAESGTFTVSVLDPKGKVLAKKKMDSLPGAEDFVPKRVEAVFQRLPERMEYTVVVDSKDDVVEIFKENNTAVVRR